MIVGFVGLGDMGRGMAHNIVSKGFALFVYDKRSEPVEALMVEGASRAESVEKIGKVCDIVCIAVFDEAQIDQVVFGTGDGAGVLEQMRPGGIILLHPTTQRSVVLRVAHAAKERGVDVLDAPMTGGGHAAAMAGTLTFLVGGEIAVLDRARPVLEAMATSIFHVGLLGAGVAAKIINNFLAVTNILAVREAIQIAKSVGIEEQTILGMVNDGGVGSNWATQNWDKLKAQEDNYTTGRAGVIAMPAKDMRLAAQMARDCEVPTPTLDALIAYGLPDMARTGLTGNGI